MFHSFHLISKKKNIFDIRKEIGNECHVNPWEVRNMETKNTTPITRVKLITRKLAGIAYGALHTALIFTTQNEHVLFEYGNEGLLGRSYLININESEIYKDIMGKADTVDVWDISVCFSPNLKLNDVYNVIDSDLKYKFSKYNYDWRKINCRHFTKDLCKKLNCNDEAHTFLNELIDNVPYIIDIVDSLLK